MVKSFGIIAFGIIEKTEACLFCWWNAENHGRRWKCFYLNSSFFGKPSHFVFFSLYFRWESSEDWKLQLVKILLSCATTSDQYSRWMAARSLKSTGYRSLKDKPLRIMEQLRGGRDWSSLSCATSSWNPNHLINQSKVYIQAWLLERWLTVI